MKQIKTQVCYKGDKQGLKEKKAHYREIRKLIDWWL